MVWDDSLATVPLHSLVREDVREWRERLHEGRQPRSINRIVRDLKAGLNRALKEGHVGDREEWALDPLVDDVEESGDSAVILSPQHRKALIDAALTAAAEFMRGLELTGARPSELAAATVADLDTKHGTLRLMHRKGRPPKLRPRSVVLSRDGLVFFRNHAPEDLVRDLVVELIDRYEGEVEQRDIFHEHIEFGLPVTLKRFMRANGIDTHGRRIVRDDAVSLDQWLESRGIKHQTVPMTIEATA